MKTTSVQNYNIQNKKSLSSKVAKGGALAGFATGASYLLKNKQELFVDSIKLAKNKGYFDTRFKCEYVAIPLAIVGVATAALALAGKGIGLISEKIQSKKMEKEIGNMIDDIAAQSLKDLEAPIDFEAIDAQVYPQEKIDAMSKDMTFKGAMDRIPVYTDSAPNIATLDFVKEFSENKPVPASAQKSTFLDDDVISTSGYDVPLYFDSPKEEMAPIGYKEIQANKNNRAYDI